MTQQFDSIIFDMDGTLWDAVDSYCKIWDVTFKQMEYSQTVSRQELLKCMGMPINEIFQKIVTVDVDQTTYLELLDKNEREMMPLLGGKLYSGVAEGIKLLSNHFKLFMVSNCGSDGLKNFLEFTQLKPYFSDTLTYGETLLPKSENIKLLITRNNLSKAVYVGDIQGDYDATMAAGLPFIHAEYGFGTIKQEVPKIHTFKELIDVIKVVL